MCNIIHFDASHCEDRLSRYGYVIYDSSGRKLFSKRGSIRLLNGIAIENIQVAEMMTCYYALSYAYKNNLKVKQIFGDNISSISLIRGDNNKCANRNMILMKRKIRILLDRMKLSNKSINWISRESNAEADYLTKKKCKRK